MDRILIAPADRRDAVLEVIESARRRLMLSPGECDDRRVIDAVDAAVQRGVRVDVLLSRRTKHGSNLRLLGLLLEAVGAHVHRDASGCRKYHAKFAVADERLALVGSMNFTRWCFKRSCDFAVLTTDRGVARGLQRLFDADCHGAAAAPPADARLVVAPDAARSRIGTLITSARRSIRLIDPKATDPRLLALIDAKASAGVAVVRRDTAAWTDPLAPHGKLLLVDDRVALTGSMALCASNLDRRREVGLLLTDRRLVRQLIPLFEGQSDEMVRIDHRGADARDSGRGAGHRLAVQLG